MQALWSDDELIERWTLVDSDLAVLGNKTGATRLGFALLLKWFEIEARFPTSADEVPAQAVTYVGAQIGVPASAFASYDWSGTINDQYCRTAVVRGEEGARSVPSVVRNGDYAPCLVEWAQLGPCGKVVQWVRHWLLGADPDSLNVFQPYVRLAQYVIDCVARNTRPDSCTLGSSQPFLLNPEVTSIVASQHCSTVVRRSYTQRPRPA